jgi:hypothetical protein
VRALRNQRRAAPAQVPRVPTVRAAAAECSSRRADSTGRAGSIVPVKIEA